MQTHTRETVLEVSEYEESINLTMVFKNLGQTKSILSISSFPP